MGSKGSVTQQEGAPRSWFRDGFFLTTDKVFLDPKVVNQVFDSDLMWWNDPLETSQMNKMLDNCLTLSVFAVPDTEEEMRSKSMNIQPKTSRPKESPADLYPDNGGFPRSMKPSDFRMVAFARVVTDYVTIAYLTDVFVIEEFQRKGLASWMMRALKELVDGWPNLRGLMLMTHDQTAARMYEKTLGAVDFDKGPSAGLVMLEMEGRGSRDVPADH